MLKYLVILLDDTSTSFCHYDNRKSESRLMSIETLRDGIRFGMMENLMIQFIYPVDALPLEHLKTIETIDHGVIAPSGSPVNADVVVFNDWDKFLKFDYSGVGTFVLRTDTKLLYENQSKLEPILHQVTRLNIVLTDMETMNDEDFEKYNKFLDELRAIMKRLYIKSHQTQCNLITDRIVLNTMNNCNAGTESITLAPNGKFYICPGFYYDGLDAVGSLEDGLDIKNPQLYRLDHAPLCRICDAYHCKRCIWLNQKTTMEVNTPSHEQCVVAHLERNQARSLLNELQDRGIYDKKQEIKEISYLDPFDVREQW